MASSAPPTPPPMINWDLVSVIFALTMEVTAASTVICASSSQGLPAPTAVCTAASFTAAGDPDAVPELVVSFYGQALMLGDSQPGLLSDERFHHKILRDSRQEVPAGT